MSTVLEFASIPRSLDAWNIGMRRVNRIMAQETRRGFQAIATGLYSNDVDILILKDGRLVRVYEVTNYNMKCYVQLERGKRYRDNLLKYDAEKVFVCSYDQNLASLPAGRKFFTQHGIKVRVMGCQD